MPTWVTFRTLYNTSSTQEVYNNVKNKTKCWPPVRRLCAEGTSVDIWGSITYLGKENKQITMEGQMK